VCAFLWPHREPQLLEKFMKKTTKKIFGATVIALTMLVASCGSSSNDSAELTVAEATGPKIVASTSWVAAFAKLAGATDITVIAPSNLQHPPDYDPKASDLEAVASADFILLAGYEGFADRLKDAAGSTAIIETVATEYYPDALEAEVLRLATAMGLDTSLAKSNIDAYKAKWMTESERVATAISATKSVIIAHAFTGVWAALAGVEPVGTFGPAPLTPSDIAKLTALNPTVVLENKHMPGGSGLVEATDAVQIDMTNFPGDDLDLSAVVTLNADALIASIK
jgi:zinc transport system substrate-binding protein